MVEISGMSEVEIKDEIRNSFFVIRKKFIKIHVMSTLSHKLQKKQPMTF